MERVLDHFLRHNLLDETAARQLEAFVSLFLAYNRHTNLSAIRDAEGVWEKHIADSLTLLVFERLAGNVLDVGTGGGLPGIPLAIAKPKLRVTLLDSVSKKVKACEHFVSELGVSNVMTVKDRAERLNQAAGYSDNYDAVLSRATAYLPTVLAWSAGFIKPGGKIILYKTPSPEELADGAAAARKLRLKLARQYNYTLANQGRQLLIYQK